MTTTHAPKNVAMLIHPTTLHTFLSMATTPELSRNLQLGSNQTNGVINGSTSRHSFSTMPEALSLRMSIRQGSKYIRSTTSAKFMILKLVTVEVDVDMQTRLNSPGTGVECGMNNHRSATILDATILLITQKRRGDARGKE